jgi:hypothetical protein
MEEKNYQREILQRLDVIICLLLDSPADEKAVSISSKVHKLSDLGLKPSEIAMILGKPLNYITATKSTKRTREKARGI